MTIIMKSRDEYEVIDAMMNYIEVNRIDSYRWDYDFEDGINIVTVKY